MLIEHNKTRLGSQQFVTWAVGRFQKIKNRGPWEAPKKTPRKSREGPKLPRVDPERVLTTTRRRITRITAMVVVLLVMVVIIIVLIIMTLIIMVVIPVWITLIIIFIKNIENKIINNINDNRGNHNNNNNHNGRLLRPLSAGTSRGQ